LAQGFQEFRRQFTFIAIFIGRLISLLGILWVTLIVGIVRVILALTVVVVRLVFLILLAVALALLVFRRGGIHSDPMCAVEHFRPCVRVGLCIDPALRFVIPFAAGKAADNPRRMPRRAGQQHVAVGKIFAMARLLAEHPANDGIFLVVLWNTGLAGVLVILVEEGDDALVEIFHRQVFLLVNHANHLQQFRCIIGSHREGQRGVGVNIIFLNGKRVQVFRFQRVIKFAWGKSYAIGGIGDNVVHRMRRNFRQATVEHVLVVVPAIGLHGGRCKGAVERQELAEERLETKTPLARLHCLNRRSPAVVAVQGADRAAGQLAQ